MTSIHDVAEGEVAVVGFVDRALLDLHDPAALTALLTGPGAGPYPRLRRLLTTVYDAEGFTDADIADAAVLEVTPMVRVAGVRRVRGQLATTQPSYTSTDLTAELRGPDDGVWVSLLADVRLTTQLTLDPGGVESAVIRSLDEITSLDDFASRFRYLDLPTFLAERDITTVEELRRSAQFLLADVHFRSSQPGDPHDLDHRHDIDLPLAVIISDTLDLAGAMQTAGELRAAAAAGPPGPTSPLLGRSTSAFAVAVVFPDAALGAGEPTVDQIDALFAGAGLLPLFADPP